MKDCPHSPPKNDSSGRRRASDQFGGPHPHWLKTLPRCFLRRDLAHRLAKPYVPRVRSEPRVPDHQEMKWMQLLWRFHEPQGGIPFHRLPHAIGQCEDEFRAREATKGRAKIGHADRGAALCTQRSKLLVRDVLHAWKSCDSEVLRSQVLLQRQAIAKLALARNSTDPVLAVEFLRNEVRRQQALVNVENEVKLSALQHVHSFSLPR